MQQPGAENLPDCPLSSPLSTLVTPFNAHKYPIPITQRASFREGEGPTQGLAAGLWLEPEPISSAIGPGCL